MTPVKSPAPFHPRLLAIFVEQCNRHGIRTVLDPFAGEGRIHRLRDFRIDTVGVELEPEFAANHPATIVGNATALPADWTGRFDAVITSPPYGNRLADQYLGDGGLRKSYAISLGRRTTPGSAAGDYFGPTYCATMEAAYVEARRVVRRAGNLILNVKSFLEDRQLVHATGWHIAAAHRAGWSMVEDPRPVSLRGWRLGSDGSRNERAELEWVLTFQAA